MSPVVIRVLLDAHQLGRNQTGNETYVRELLRELRTIEHLRIDAAVERGSEGTGVLAPPVRLCRVPSNGLGRLAALSLLARRERPDVVHAIYFLPPGTGRPTVLTVHDISFERHPEFFGRRALARDRFLIRESARRATRVVTVSETSRRDLIQLYGLAEERVVAIPNGVSPVYQPRDDWSPYRGDRPYRVLAVGTLQPRKNLIRLVDAVEGLSREIPVSLRIVGPDGHQAARIRERLERSVTVEIRGWLPEEELARAYREADVFAYPSIYEGFGLPVVEAMASGTPVVTTTGGSLPEIAGDAALIVDPLDVKALEDALRRIADEPEEATSIRARGLRRAALFSWRRSAELHARAYADLAD